MRDNRGYSTFFVGESATQASMECADHTKDIQYYDTDGTKIVVVQIPKIDSTIQKTQECLT